jgi:hypothetical protein
MAYLYAEEKEVVRMASKEEYDVLRLIEHGQTCYISSECVEGRVLAGWLKEQPGIGKGRLFSLLRDIAGQLGMIHKCRKKPCYQYVNPYSIVITREGKPYFLDMEAGSNEKHLKFMQKRTVRECFLPAQETYYQRASTELDIYGMGKTIQYILSVTGPQPPLNRREERRFQKIISKCLKYQSKLAYQSAAEIRRNIPQYRKKTKHSRIRKKRMFMIAGAVLLLAAAWKLSDLTHPGKRPEEVKASLAAREIREPEELAPQKETWEDGIEGKAARPDDNTAYMELALAYILDVGDYEESLYYLDKIKDENAAARDLQEIVKALLGKRKASKDLEGYLEELEEEAPEGSEERWYRCLIRGYGLLNTRRSAEAVLRLGKICLDMMDGESEEAKEVKEYMASACERADVPEEAARIYEELLEQTEDSRKREETYRKITVLYEICGQKDRALDTCIRGIEEQKESDELKIMHIRLLCQDAAVERELCAQTIREYIGQRPEILEKEEFQKLQREYEIQVEGDSVWVGR